MNFLLVHVMIVKICGNGRNYMQLGIAGCFPVEGLNCVYSLSKSLKSFLADSNLK